MTKSYEAMDLDKEAQPPVITAMMGPDRTTVMFASSMRKFEGAGTSGKYNYANKNWKKLF
jgi:hypothetical protein